LKLHFIISGLLVFHCTAIGKVAASEQEKSGRLFSLKIRNILSSKCFACHGEDGEKIKGELDLTSHEGLMRGGESGASSIQSGNPMLSPLYLASTRDHEDDWPAMPPKENDKLSKEQIEDIKTWIKTGAHWPDKTTQEKYIAKDRKELITEDGILVKTSGGLSEDWTYRRYQENDIWAFQEIQKEPIPKTEKNPIDFFIKRKLKKNDFPPAPEANFRVLVKRAYYNLTGLPPSPYEIYQFRIKWGKDKLNAWEDLIDKLLESPHYGEHWGQHWLDVTRYSDTGGYSNDYERSNAWRYRDYVVRSFNNDKAYNEFIVEQIAGDELWQLQSKDHRNSELLIATSFLRMGPWDPAMVKVPEARQIFIDDVVNSVGQTFLSLTMRCVKCHDHKFDPVPTRDYYRMYSVFAGTQMAERNAPFMEEENLARFSQEKKLVQTMLDYAKQKTKDLVEKREQAARNWFVKAGTDYVPHNERKKLPDNKKPPRHVGLNHIDQGRLKVREQDSWIWGRRLERYEPLAQSVYNGQDPVSLNARKLRIKKTNGNWIPDSKIYMGGSLQAPGEKVSPGVLSATSVSVSDDNDTPYLVKNDLQGRRLAFAKWIANPKNPLTARSIVNRIWQHHFGKAIAGNPNNLGAKGQKPTHPELLDWLAKDFVENGWKFKRLHKMIMLSKTYMQSSSHPLFKELQTKDPENNLFAYHLPHRLTAEQIRDSLLKITGELNPLVGGIPIMPEINMEVALEPRMIQFSIAPAHQPSKTPKERNRRTLYAYRVRGQADPFLEIFNQPNSNDSCEERVSQSVIPQAFSLMNSDTMSDRSIALALRIEKEMETVPLQVKRAVQLTFGRVPEKKEQERLEKYVMKMRKYHKNHQPDKITYPTKITRSLVEELSGKPFKYEEILPNFERYTSDKKPSDVSADTRTLADLCLLLFNTNEFIYIY
jgi:hypothetical protein